MSYTTAPAGKAYDLSGVTILVAEDFPFMADLMSSMLREFSVGNILTTCTVKEAEQLIMQHDVYTDQETDKKTGIDILITDWFAPGGDGLELLSWIRHHEHDNVQYLPVLFCSTHASREVVIAGRDAGSNEILLKPISAEKLAARLLHIIDKPRSFIKAPSFFGPDRRRKDEYRDEERRIRSNDNIRVTHETE